MISKGFFGRTNGLGSPKANSVVEVIGSMKRM